MRVKIFHDRLPAELKQQTVQGRTKIAQQIASEARDAAPVLTGRYLGGIGVDVSGTTVRVVDEDDTAIHKEYGTSDTPAHAALTSAAMNHGRYRGMRPRGGRR